MTADDVRQLADDTLKRVQEQCESGDEVKGQAALLSVPSLQLKFLGEITAQLITLNDSMSDIKQRLANLDQGL